MKRHLVCLLIVFVCSISVFAQGSDTFEYGSPAELKGLTNIFVDTGADMETRSKITEIITKAKLPNIRFLDKITQAQIVLVFRGDTEEKLTGAARYGTSTVLGRIQLEYGTGSVLVGLPEYTKPHLVLTVKNSQQTKWEKSPATKFAKEFIKAWKEANGVR